MNQKHVIRAESRDMVRHCRLNYRYPLSFPDSKPLTRDHMFCAQRTFDF